MKRRLIPVRVLAMLVAAGVFVLVFTNLRSARHRAAEKGRSGPIDVTLFRLFGGCSDKYSGVTDLDKAVGECGVIQVLTNKFNTENQLGVRINTQTVEWSAYYDRLSASFAAGSPPDVAVMHRSMLPSFARRGLLAPIGKALRNEGVDWDDYLSDALAGVTFGGELLGMPYDVHGLVWHLNLDLFAKAGLIDRQGAPLLPSSPESLLAQAALMKERTGVRYLAIPSETDPMPTWTFETWIWQQGADLMSKDLSEPTLDTAASRAALGLLDSIYAQGDADPGLDYAGAEQAFLSGQAAALINGTWAVDSYLDQAREPGSRLKHYAAYTVPQLYTQLAAWTDSHVWVIPRQLEPGSPKYRAVLSFLGFLSQHAAAWARTGHLPVRKSVLEDPRVLSLPSRKTYIGTARIARAFPSVRRQRAIQDELVQQINATWLAGRPKEDALAKAQKKAREILQRDRAG